LERFVGAQLPSLQFWISLPRLVIAALCGPNTRRARSAFIGTDSVKAVTRYVTAKAEMLSPCPYRPVKTDTTRIKLGIGVARMEANSRSIWKPDENRLYDPSFASGRPDRSRPWCVDADGATISWSSKNIAGSDRLIDIPSRDDTRRVWSISRRKQPLCKSVKGFPNNLSLIAIGIEMHHDPNLSNHTFVFIPTLYPSCDQHLPAANIHRICFPNDEIHGRPVS